MINRQALFTDETATFKTPYEPKRGDKVKLRFRTLKGDVLRVFLILGNKTILMKKDKNSGDDFFDYYTASFTCGVRPVSYYFKLEDDNDEVYYNRLGAVNNNQAEYNFSFVPGFSVPDWAKGRVFYQIYCDRFCNGNPNNDVEDNEYYYTGGHSRKIKDWYQLPGTLDVNCFYGGDLQGVEKKLDYLSELGIEAVYFNPLFVSPSNHKYDTQDYDYIDPHLAIIEHDLDHKMEDWEKHNGYAPKYIRRVTDKTNLERSNEYFAGLVRKMHARGIKVVVDGVFNHCGSFHKWMDREGIYLNKPGYKLGAYQSVDSKYRKYFKFKRPDIANSEYEGWWGYTTLPKLNYEESDELVEKIMKVGEKWVSKPFFADGWRLDVAADLGHSEKFNHKFWKKFKERVRASNPDAFIFAEHYGNPSAWLNGGEWDSVMNYDAFMEPVTWFLTGMEKHSDEFNEGMLGNSDCFIGSMKYHMASFYAPSLMTAMNELSNHDHSRFLTRTNHKVGRVENLGSEAAEQDINKAVFREAVVIQMTWPGAPTIYYGDEAGLCGFTDPDNRRTYPWGREDQELISFHRDMIRIHKENYELLRGSVKFLANDYQQISYGRFTDREKTVVTINNSDETKMVELSVWELGIPRSRTCKFRQLMVTGDFGYSLVKKIHECKAGVIRLEVPSHGAIIVKCVLDQEK